MEVVCQTHSIWERTVEVRGRQKFSPAGKKFGMCCYFRSTHSTRMSVADAARSPLPPRRPPPAVRRHARILPHSIAARPTLPQRPCRGTGARRLTLSRSSSLAPLRSQVRYSHLGHRPPRLQRPRLRRGRGQLQHRGASPLVRCCLPARLNFGVSGCRGTQHAASLPLSAPHPCESPQA